MSRLRSLAILSFGLFLVSFSYRNALADTPRIAAGWYHSLAVKDNGEVWSWGYNGYGQLGDTTTTERHTPQMVSGVSGAVGVAGGARHTVAVKSDGSVLAWGYNADGELGDGSTTQRLAPVAVSGLTGVTAVAAGSYHTLAMKSDGTVWAWGYNNNGQLGDGTTTNRTTAVQVSGLTGVTAVAAGDEFSLARKSDGTVWAWGYNGYGQLGDGSTTRRLTPVQVSGLSGISAIAAGNAHSLAVKSDGSVAAWGYNAHGELGDGTTINRTTPVPVSGVSAVAAVGCGQYHSLALKGDGTIWAWGYNAYGQLGDGSTTTRLTPVQAPGLAGMAAVAGGDAHSLALHGDGRVWAWGNNGNGRLGDGSTATAVVPQGGIIDVSQTIVVTPTAGGGGSITPATPQSVATGSVLSFAMTPVAEYGIASATGCGGSLSGTSYTTAPVTGDCTVTVTFAPLATPAPTAVTPRLSAGALHTVAVKSNGRVWGWGYNGNGQLGDGTTTSRTMPVPTGDLLGTTVAVAGGYRHTLAVKNDGSVWGWGYNNWGQLGDGTTDDRRLPVQVSGLTGMTAAAAGDGHSLGRKSDGTVWAWGYNGHGELGNGSTAERTTPVPVFGLTGVTMVAAGANHSLALKSDGTVWAWGLNNYGQLGDGSTVNRTIPVQVSGLTGITAVAADGSHSLALKSDGTVWAWGLNNYGQLGDGSTVNRTTAVQVLGLTGAAAVAAGDNHSLAVKSGGVWAWGLNNYGQLGDGTTTSRSTAAVVPGVTGAVAVAAGDAHSVALKGDGTIFSWGLNNYGQLGDGSTANGVVPQESGIDLTQTLTVTPTAGSGGSITPATPQSVTTGGLASFTVTPNAGYGIASATGCGGSLSGTSYTTAPVTGDCTVTVTFAPLANPPATGITPRLSAGALHTMAVKSNGTVWAWGYNGNGHLGDGTTVSRPSPVPVADLLGTSVAVAGGYRHTVATLSDGSVWAWGLNNYGQLGDGTTVDRWLPTQVSGLAGMTAVAAGDYHSLAVKSSDGTVWAWGSNNNGELGDGTTADRLTPDQVYGLTGVTAVAAGADHSLALKSDGTVWAWGYNGYGQLGDGSTTGRTIPVQVLGLTGVTAVAADGNHSLAVRSDGTVWAWGLNNYGQLGDGTTTSRSTPVQVLGLTGATAVAAGDSHSLAVKSGGVWAWGLNNHGQLGDGTTANRSTAAAVSGVTGAVAVAAGDAHSVALMGDGTIQAWGYNGNGQLGTGNTASAVVPQESGIDLTQTLTVTPTAGSGGSISPATPQSVATGGVVSFTVTPNAGYGIASATGCGGSLSGTTYTTAPMIGDCSVQVTFDLLVSPPPLSVTPRISAGALHTMGVKSDGSVWGWGYNGNGQLGDDTVTSRTVPVPTIGLLGTSSAVAAGYRHTVAARSNGSVWAWGYNGYGQLGDGTTVDRWLPTQVSGLAGMTAVAAGDYHSLAVKSSDGTVWAWGSNNNGELGNGTTADRLTPDQVYGLTGVTAVAAGADHSLALKSDGTVWAWGYNGYGQLGDGSTTSRTTPVQVSILTGVTAVATDGNHSLAVKSDGTVWAWGLNNYGQLGDGTTVNRSTPVQVLGLSGATGVAAGDNHSLAVKSDGTVWAWGYNANGQLGDGTTTSRPTAAAVPGVTGAVAVTAGDAHSVALKNDGTIQSWGYNGYGQLGDGTTTQRTAAAATQLPNTLSVLFAGNGNGTVRLMPQLINCLAGICSYDFPTGGTATTLSAVIPNSYTTFMGWSGGGCSGTGTCSLGMARDTKVVATFGTAALYQTMAGEGNGRVTSDLPGLIDCAYQPQTGTCTTKQPVTTALTLTASMSPEYGVEWSGGCSSCTGPTCSLTLPLGTNTYCTATFNLLPVRIYGTPPAYYPTLQQAYNAAAGAPAAVLMQAQGVTMAGSLTLNAAKNIVLKGGYDKTFTSQTGITIVDGSVTVSKGSLIVDELSIR